MQLSKLTIPSRPDEFYKEFKGWEDLLGVPVITMSRNCVDYETAKELIAPLKIKDQSEFEKEKNLGNIPIEIPKNPQGYYSRRSAWQGWGDFLGRKSLRLQDYPPFEEFVYFVRSIGIKTKQEWDDYWVINKDTIPYPRSVDGCYKRKSEWTSWPEVTGCVENQKGRYLDYLEAKSKVKKMGFSSRYDFSDWREKNDCDIPKAPESVYKDEWESWYAFLGKDKITHATYEECKKIIYPLQIKSLAKFKKNKDDGTIPACVPYNPALVYKDSWKGAGDFLGSNNVTYADREWVTLLELKNLVKLAKCETREQYRDFQSKNQIINGKFVPNAPNHLYKGKGWSGWVDLFGRSKGKGFKHLSYKEAKNKVQLLKFNNQKEYQKASKENKLPLGVPANPLYTYSKEFEGWHEWLGKVNSNGNKCSKQWRSYDDAKKFVHSVRLRSTTEWAEFRKSDKMPTDIPSDPWRVYPEFENWKEFLGN